jgi:hypothetical protein
MANFMVMTFMSNPDLEVTAIAEAAGQSTRSLGGR